MSLGPLYVLLGEVSVQVFAHFVIGLFVLLEWSYMSSLYVLETKPLSKVSLANMFSHMVGSLLIFLMFSVAMQKPFILMKFHLFILSFMSLALEKPIQKRPMHPNVHSSIIYNSQVLKTT